MGCWDTQQTVCWSQCFQIILNNEQCWGWEKASENQVVHQTWYQNSQQQTTCGEEQLWRPKILKTRSSELSNSAEHSVCYRDLYCHAFHNLSFQLLKCLNGSALESPLYECTLQWRVCQGVTKLSDFYCLLVQVPRTTQSPTIGIFSRCYSTPSHKELQSY